MNKYLSNSIAVEYTNKKIEEIIVSGNEVIGDTQIVVLTYENIIADNIKNSAKFLTYDAYSNKQGNYRIIVIDNKPYHLHIFKLDRENLNKSILEIKEKIKSIGKKDTLVMSMEEIDENIKTRIILDIYNHLYAWGINKKEDYTIYIKENTQTTNSHEWIDNIKNLLSCIRECKEVVNRPHNLMDTEIFTQRVNDFISEMKDENVKITIFNSEEIEKMGMNCLFSVGKASKHGSKLIIVEYKGNKTTDEYIGVAGKGIVFDTGGINLKSTTGLKNMYDDMAGAATAFAAISYCIKNSLKTNIVVALPICENSIGEGLRPGDIIKTFDGTSVEIKNTDAEGRLVLNDAVGYLDSKFKLSSVIVLATLTGLAAICFGPEVSALCCDSENLLSKMKNAANKTFEAFVHMNHHELYEHCIKGESVDINNTGGEYGGIYNGALFIKHAVKKTPAWCHIDIAGTAFNSTSHPRISKNATAYGVFLLTELFKNL